jgi:hypothetical protein
MAGTLATHSGSAGRRIANHLPSSTIQRPAAARDVSTGRRHCGIFRSRWGRFRPQSLGSTMNCALMRWPHSCLQEIVGATRASSNRPLHRVDLYRRSERRPAVQGRLPHGDRGRCHSRVSRWRLDISTRHREPRLSCGARCDGGRARGAAPRFVGSRHRSRAREYRRGVRRIGDVRAWAATSVDGTSAGPAASHNRPPHLMLPSSC